MKQFKSGDRVERLDKVIFSNNEKVVTISHVDSEKRKAWFKETATWMPFEKLKIHNPVNPRILDVLEEQKDELQSEVDYLLNKLKGKEEELSNLHITIKTVKAYT